MINLFQNDTTWFWMVNQMYWNEEKAGWVPSFDMVESASFKNADLFTAVVTV